MRVSVIDLGTNSLRFAIYDLQSSKHSKRCIYKQKIMLRPGRGVFTSGRLQQPVMAQIARAICQFHRAAVLRQTDVIEAFATSALREAKNAKVLIEQVKKACGVTIRVISGQREASLIARGILNGERELSDKFALIDIGGGSTEISLCQKRRSVLSLSLRLGSVRLQQLFLPEAGLPAGKDQRHRISAMRRYIRTQLNRHEHALTKIHVPMGLGSSGSIRSLERVITKSVNLRYFLPVRLRRENERPHFSRAALSHFIELLTPLKLSEVKKLPGLESKRADLILPAAVLLEEIMLFLGIDEIQTTDFSLRDGLVLEVIDMQLQKKSLKWRINQSK
jgi:exopolyphosphatase/guanosine-5'-triphosphate,3'-diphosphate pyrophosphatase